MRIIEYKYIFTEYKCELLNTNIIYIECKMMLLNIATIRQPYTNSRIDHFLPEHIAFNQSALGLFLPASIAPRTTRGYHTIELSSFFAWIPVT